MSTLSQNFNRTRETDCSSRLVDNSCEIHKELLNIEFAINVYTRFDILLDHFHKSQIFISFLMCSHMLGGTSQ